MITIDDRGLLRWRESGIIRESPARLSDVSADRALVVAEDPPPLHQIVRFRIETPVPSEWFEAFVAGRDSSNEVDLVLGRVCRP